MTKRLFSFLICVAFLFMSIFSFTAKNIFFPAQESNVLSSQYTKTISLYYPRGTIYDRNGIPFTNRNDENSFGLPILQTDITQVAYYVTGELIYEENNTTSDGCYGANGLQLAYNEILNGGSPVKIVAEVDADGNLLGENYVHVVNDHYNEGGNISITLDFVWQKFVEEKLKDICEEREYKGACVLLTEISTGKIIVMASYGDYMNKTLLSYQPGSVMKIITAAAALENGIVTPQTEYECVSSVNVGNQTKYCSDKTVHGKISFAQAFADSCNCCFYETAKKLCVANPDGTYSSKALDLAVQWGFNIYGENMHKEFELDYDGHYSFVPDVLYNELNIFNAALGQGDIQASPYIINKITAAIANGGKIIKPYIVESVKDPAGNDLLEIDHEEFDLGLSDSTVKALIDMMILCEENGTASHNDSDVYGGFGGKTGTAENLEGAPSHSWFTGFFPAENPEYALTVFIEEGGGASGNAVYLFDQTAHLINDMNAM